MATSASGSSLNQPDCGDHYDTDARSSGEYTDRSLGSMVDKNDYVKYSERTNTFYTGCEKDGFISKAHERVYNAIEARIAVLKELEANPSNPLVQVSHTGLRPNENAFLSEPRLDELKISKQDFMDTVDYLNKARTDGGKLSGYMVFKPNSPVDPNDPSKILQIQNIDGVKLTIESKQARDGSVLYVRGQFFSDLTNKRMESTILHQLKIHTGRITGTI
jgi:hypothetical protein